MRESRGVYYTPEPVVSYIVRSVDYLLKKEFGLADGLADATTIKQISKDGTSSTEIHKVQILDPATGTGTFLHSIIDSIHETFKGNKGMWSAYVSQHLLPRLFGFELLMAPYAVAHMKLGLQLKETGYDFHGKERLGVYLTNTLEEGFEGSKLPFVEWIIEEATAAGNIKHEAPVMVVIQWRIQSTGYGILAFITNHGYLDNPTFRGMRQSLLQSFDEIYVLDLHGNSKKKERSPDGSKDENVFDIQQGVAIGIFVKHQKKTVASEKAVVHHAHLWGAREVYEKLGQEHRLVGGKYHWLAIQDISATIWTRLKPQEPFYLFVPQDTNLLTEYESAYNIQLIMPEFSLGCLTKSDRLVIGQSQDEVRSQVQSFLDVSKSDTEAASEFGLVMKDQDMWNAAIARRSIKLNDIDKFIRQEAYRLFDTRYIFYHDKFIARLNRRIMHNLDHRNLALVTVRQLATLPFEHIWVTDILSDQCLISTRTKEGGVIFPLYLYPYEGELPGLSQTADAAPGGRRPNLSPAFIADISAKLHMQFIPDSKGDLQQQFGPEDVFHYMYAVFHSPTYRMRYAEFLKIDFPRLPLTSDATLFRTLCMLGKQLVGLHLMEHYGKMLTHYPVEGNNLVERVEDQVPKEQPERGRVFINKTQYFEGVPAEVWNFHVGGYQVCHKWLKDRKGRVLSFDDIRHYQRIVAALAATITLMEQVDEAIEEHGGWPFK
jgi:predicted helicase